MRQRDRLPAESVTSNSSNMRSLRRPSPHGTSGAVDDDSAESVTSTISNSYRHVRAAKLWWLIAAAAANHRKFRTPIAGSHD